MPPFIEDALLWLLEAALANAPGRKPRPEQLDRARIVAHRGERDGIRIRENTLAAFDPVVAAGVGAIEFDVRYTHDDEPVIIHDPSLARVFGWRERVDALPWARLRARVPELPHLDEMLQRYAGRTHLMIEVKTRGSARAEARLADRLAPLTAVADYHVLSLDPTLYAALPDLPAAARMPVARLRWGRIQQWSERHGCGGLAGPFFIIRSRDVARNSAAGRSVGSGFINRGGLLMREIARDIPWIFTDRPLALQALLDRARERARPA